MDVPFLITKTYNKTILHVARRISRTLDNHMTLGKAVVFLEKVLGVLERA